MNIPRYWYNLAADVPSLSSDYLDPRTRKALVADDLENLFPPELAAQELATDRVWVPIPEPIRETYARWRPTPLRRAKALERALGTSCQLYYKYEGVSPIGSHKANSGVAQAYYARRAGARRVVAETGAGQWGTAISMGAAFQGLDCDVFMVRNSYQAKPGRRLYMEAFGSTVHASPSPLTQAGKVVLEQDPDSPGSLGLAIAEAVESASADPSTCYSLGSAFNFVCLHQTVIGMELLDQLNAIDVEADLLISCIGGGSSFAGLAFPFFGRSGSGRKQPEFLAVESNAVPTATAGTFAYDHGDSAGLTPLAKMYTLGHVFAPPGIHSGGLRYHGLSPLVSQFLHEGHGRAVAIPQMEVFQAALAFTRAEGIIPAPESAHGIAAAIRVATEHKHEDLSIVFLLTGHGHFDMASYGQYLGGTMEESSTPFDVIEESLRRSLSDRSPTARTPGAGPSPALSGKVGTDTAPPATATAGSRSFQAWWQRNFAEEPVTCGGVPAGGPAPVPTVPTVASASACEVDLTGVAVLTARVLADEAVADATTVRIARSTVITPLAAEELHRRSIRVQREA